LLTGTGRALAVAAILLFIAGAALGYVELSVFGAGALLALAAGALWLLRRATLEVTRVIEPARVQRGGVALGLVSVTNIGQRDSPEMSAQDVVGAATVTVPLPHLAAGARRTTTYRLPTAKRGAVAVGPLTIMREDPLGALRRSQIYGTTETLWVHPVVHPLTSAPAGRSRHLDGPTSDTAPQGSLTFHSLREYVPGDDLRHIHWRSTARLGELMVVTHVDTSQPQTTILLDTRAGSYDDVSFEEAMDVAASVIVASTSKGFPVRLRTTDGIAVPAKGTARESSVFLDMLALLKPSSEGSMARAAEALSRQRRADALIVITGSADADATRAVASLHHKFDRTTLARIGRRRGAREAEAPIPPGIGIVKVSTAAEFAAAWNRGLHLLTAR
jgi:uncharacterized protein (DUF58 family)